MRPKFIIMNSIEDKPDYRYKYFKDSVNTTLTICGGGIIAAVTFTTSLKVIYSKTLLQWGLGVLLVAMALLMLQPFLMALASGSWWDWKQSGFKDGSTAKEVSFYGHTAGLFLALSIILSLCGFFILAIFLSRNIR